MATPDNQLNLLGNPITKGLPDKARNGLFLNYFRYLNRFLFLRGHQYIMRKIWTHWVFSEFSKEASAKPEAE